MNQLSIFEASIKKIGKSKNKLPSFDLDSYVDKNYLTHNLHPYPAKFIPQIPRELITNFTKEDDLILDPFCGCGTTMVEAKILKRNGIANDLNPLATLITDAKTIRYNPTQIAYLEEKYIPNLDSSIVAYLEGNKSLDSLEIPDFKNRDHWFEELALIELAYIKSSIDEQSDENLRTLLSVVFSSIIVKASRQESDTRWKAIDKGYRKADALIYFKSKLHNALSRIKKFSEITSSSNDIAIYNENAKLLEFIPDNHIDFVVTSPPYMNSYDYYLYHKLRLFWLGFDHYKVQRQEIGSRNKHSDNKVESKSYEDEMEQCLAEIYRVLKPGRFASIIIGDSILRGKFFRMDKIYSSLAKNVGFKVLDIFKFNQRKYTRSFTNGYQTERKHSYILLLNKN